MVSGSGLESFHSSSAGSLLELVHDTELLLSRGSGEVNAGSLLHVHVVDFGVFEWVSVVEVHHSLRASFSFEFLDVCSFGGSKVDEGPF